MHPVDTSPAEDDIYATINDVQEIHSQSSSDLPTRSLKGLQSSITASTSQLVELCTSLSSSATSLDLHSPSVGTNVTAEMNSMTSLPSSIESSLVESQLEYQLRGSYRDDVSHVYDSLDSDTDTDAGQRGGLGEQIKHPSKTSVSSGVSTHDLGQLTGEHKQPKSMRNSK